MILWYGQRIPIQGSQLPNVVLVISVGRWSLVIGRSSLISVRSRDQAKELCACF
jgi:hypothetical protein